MPIGTTDNMILRPEFFEAGFLEGVGQNIDVFNESSQNAIRFATRELEGDFAKTRFWDRVPDLVTYRDDTDTSDAESSVLGQSDHIAVKTKRNIGPIENTIDSLRSVASSPEEFSFMFGEQAGEDAAKDYLNTGLRSAVAALTNQSRVFVDEASSGNTLNHSLLNALLATFGDARGDLVAFVMHSAAFTDLVENNISSAGDQTEFATIFDEAPGSFTRPVVVTDSDALVNEDGIEAGDDSYYTLALQESALDVSESDSLDIWEKLFPEKENATILMKGESAITIDMLGFTWDETDGGRNPDDSALATGSNWEPDHDQHKNWAGAVLEHDA